MTVFFTFFNVESILGFQKVPKNKCPISDMLEYFPKIPVL